MAYSSFICTYVFISLLLTIHLLVSLSQSVLEFCGFPGVLCSFFSLYSFLFSLYLFSLALFFFFFFKQKTAYEMRISDWSSDVCSSDLTCLVRSHRRPLGRPTASSADRSRRVCPTAGGHRRAGTIPLAGSHSRDGRARCAPWRGQPIPARKERYADASGDHLQGQDRKSTRLNSSH